MRHKAPFDRLVEQLKGSIGRARRNPVATSLSHGRMSASQGTKRRLGDDTFVPPDNNARKARKTDETPRSPIVSTSSKGKSRTNVKDKGKAIKRNATEVVPRLALKKAAPLGSLTTSSLPEVDMSSVQEGSQAAVHQSSSTSTIVVPEPLSMFIIWTRVKFTC